MLIEFCHCCHHSLFRFFLAHPVVSKNPAQYRAYGSPADHGDWRDALLKDDRETAEEYDDRSDMLDDDAGVYNQRPELVGSKTRVALEVV